MAARRANGITASRVRKDGAPLAVTGRRDGRAFFRSAHVIYRAFTLPADLVQAVDGPFILAPRNDDQEVHALLCVAVMIVLATALWLAAVTA